MSTNGSPLDPNDGNTSTQFSNATTANQGQNDQNNTQQDNILADRIAFVEQREKLVEMKEQACDASVRQKEEALVLRGEDMDRREAQRNLEFQFKQKQLDWEKDALKKQQEIQQQREEAFKREQEAFKILQQQREEVFQREQEAFKILQQQLQGASKAHQELMKREAEMESQNQHEKHNLLVEKHKLEEEKYHWYFSKKIEFEKLQQAQQMISLGDESNLLQFSLISAVSDNVQNSQMYDGKLLSNNETIDQKQCEKCITIHSLDQRAKQLKIISEQLIKKYDHVRRDEAKIKAKHSHLDRNKRSFNSAFHVARKAHVKGKKYYRGKEKLIEKRAGELKEEKIKAEAAQKEARLTLDKRAGEFAEQQKMATNYGSMSPEEFKQFCQQHFHSKMLSNYLSMSDTEFKQFCQQQVKELIIDPCNANSKHYGASETKFSVEFRCEQLGKQIHIYAPHYLNLLRDFIATGNNHHINPHDASFKFNSKPTLDYYWKSDTDSGKAPKYSPQLRLYFSTPNILGGEWILFNGGGVNGGNGGSKLFEVDPSFQLTVGSLCDPSKEGEFTSITHLDPANDPNKNNGKQITSHYQISIKWEP